MLKKVICQTMIASLLAVSMQTAGAGMIGADRAVTNSTQAERTLVLSVLNRADTVAALQAHGVDPAQARERVAVMSDQEVRELANDINSAPAGAAITFGGVLLVVAVAAAVWYFVFRR
jgi:hypothetical protein